jgi:hypothetical protein
LDYKGRPRLPNTLFETLSFGFIHLSEGSDSQPFAAMYADGRAQFHYASPAMIDRLMLFGFA